MNNPYFIPFGKYSVELSNGQVLVKEGRELLSVKEVGNNFGSQDLLKLAKTYAEKLGVTVNA